MYPELVLPLVALLGAACGLLAFLLLRRPVLRRLAIRQASRRRTEAALVIIGSALGTTIIVASLVVGDTLNFSVKQDAYRTLGPVDERVVTGDPAAGEVAARALRGLRSDPLVDGVLTARSEQVAVVLDRDGRHAAQPRTLVWDMDFAAAERFGGSSADSGLTGPSPRPSEVVLNDLLATDLGAHVGDTVMLYLYEHPTPLWVARIVPARGLAGGGFGSPANRNAFVAPGTLAEVHAKTGRVSPRTVTLVSNRGGVEGGNRYSDQVAAHIRQIISPLPTAGTSVETPKKDVLAEAKVTGDALGALFL